MAAQTTEGEELIATIKNAAGLILAVTENRNWIEVFLEGDAHSDRQLAGRSHVRRLHRRSSS